ncbi:histidine phosphatase family protein [Peribacillus cavernae]|uniref:Histidine phosphatase family protein n=1 Tax=Peribacillus cavernae TaxID=1674310 RepID=A0A433HTE0_9BACI|nr:histidine phosphatase family protein [Peribacillus cavernae]MDQ0218589.1 alpha-ribazole phosphatase [Peribacillus cavernae]RUQ31577.1 histidine phosphatase family protein [Peribacillus cavernae]
MDDNLVVTLFRHGLTFANERKAYLGWTDSALSRKGKEQLSQIADDVQAVFSSDLTRCIDTAAILFPKIPAIKKREFREIHFGAWEGKTYQALQDDSDYQNWLEQPFTRTPPGGENYEKFADRIQSGWEACMDEVMSQGVKRTAIVTHGGVIRYLLMKFAPVERAFWEWSVTHGTGWELTFKTDDLRRGKRCILLQEVHITANHDG